MEPTFNIFNKTISKNSPTLIIAEIGINHMGSEELCAQMILSALGAGADCIKLQTVNIEESYHPNTLSYSTFKNCELSKDALERLSKLTKDNNGFLFSTPGDLSSLSLLESIGVAAYKVSSGLITNLPLIEEISNTKKPIIFSTGMAKVEDIDNIFKIVQYNNISLLHCVSLYPTPLNLLNLSYIRTLSNNYGVISGYSDHSNGDIACIAAVGMGAKIIEKHFTIDNKLKGADNKMSMDAKSFKTMCKKIREIDSMINGSSYKPHPLELNIRDSRYRKIAAKENIKIGEVFSKQNVCFIRYEGKNNSIDASKWSLISGKISKNFIEKSQMITLDNI